MTQFSFGAAPTSNANPEDEYGSIDSVMGIDCHIDELEAHSATKSSGAKCALSFGATAKQELKLDFFSQKSAQATPESPSPSSASQTCSGSTSFLFAPARKGNAVLELKSDSAERSASSHHHGLSAPASKGHNFTLNPTPAAFESQTSAGAKISLCATMDGAAATSEDGTDEKKNQVAAECEDSPSHDPAQPLPQNKEAEGKPRKAAPSDSNAKQAAPAPPKVHHVSLSPFPASVQSIDAHTHVMPQTLTKKTSAGRWPMTRSLCNPALESSRRLSQKSAHLSTPRQSHLCRGQPPQWWPRAL